MWRRSCAARAHTQSGCTSDVVKDEHERGDFIDSGPLGAVLCVGLALDESEHALLRLPDTRNESSRRGHSRNGSTRYARRVATRVSSASSLDRQVVLLSPWLAQACSCNITLVKQSGPPTPATQKTKRSLRFRTSPVCCTRPLIAQVMNAPETQCCYLPNVQCVSARHAV